MNQDLNYTVITADIIDSRKYQNLSEELGKRLKQFNQSPEIAVPFSFFKGDEIQGVLTGFFVYPQLVRQLRYLLLPYKLRIGIGIGTIMGVGTADTSWKMNGPAFYYAREALEGTEESRLSRTMLKSEFEFIDQMVNTLYLLIDSIEDRWTDAQWEAIHLYEKWGTYRRAARDLKIALQNVEKRCSAANWRQVREVEGKLSDLIRFYFELVGE